MRQHLIGLTIASALLGAFGSGAQAQPLVATFSGYIIDPNTNADSTAFTAAFHYNTGDLVTDGFDSDYLDGKPQTSQWATFSSGGQTLTFYNFLTFPEDETFSFSKGEYNSTVYDSNGDGNISEIDTVHSYSIQGTVGSLSGSQGYLSLTFGGSGDGGLYTLGTDGMTTVELDPTHFALDKDTISPVPLPSPLLMFGSALAVFGFAGYRRQTRAA